MKLKIGDFVITGLVLLIAFLTVFSLTVRGTNNLTAVITQNGQVIKEINLSELSSPLEFAIDGKYHNSIRAEQGKIRFVESSCPDDICVQTGWLTKPGQVATCLPNGVLIKIEGSNAEVDIYLR